MTPRHYYLKAEGLTVDNRPPEHTETLQDEIRALRADRLKLQLLLVAMVAALEEDLDE